LQAGTKISPISPNQMVSGVLPTPAPVRTNPRLHARNIQRMDAQAISVTTCMGQAAHRFEIGDFNGRNNAMLHATLLGTLAHFKRVFG
jgi:hypothetical protein